MHTHCLKPAYFTLLALVFALTPAPALSQGALKTIYESPLMLGDGQLRRGTVQAMLDDHNLELFITFGALQQPWIQIDLYRGNPAEDGTAIENLAIQVPNEQMLGGGLATTVTLSDDNLTDLNDGLLYIVVHAVSGDAAHRLSGKIELVPIDATDYLETPLSDLWQAMPVARGRTRTMITPDGLRLIGYVNGLLSNWSVIGLYRGEYGQAGEQLATIYNFGSSGLNDAFDHTFEMAEGWEDDLRAGRLFVLVQTSREEDALSGRLYPSTNQAPAASDLESPAHGETIVVGGPDGGEPVDPNVYLGHVSYTRVEDPDENPVAYLWQASLREDFQSPTITYDFGIDSTRFPLTVRDAAGLVDDLTRLTYGEVRHFTPVIIYHRVITTDGSLFAVGAAQSVTFVRGTVTSRNESEVTDRFTLHGNYPNPFNPSTTVVFDLPAAAHVAVDVFDVMGRRVMTLPEQALSSGPNQRVDVDGSALASGSYVYRIQARTASGITVESGRMTLVK